MKIHISQTTKNLLGNKSYKMVERGKIEVKGKGEMKTYFVITKLDEDGKSIKCPFMEVMEEFQRKNPGHQLLVGGEKENKHDGFKKIDERPASGRGGGEPNALSF